VFFAQQTLRIRADSLLSVQPRTTGPQGPSLAYPAARRRPFSARTTQVSIALAAACRKDVTCLSAPSACAGASSGSHPQSPSSESGILSCGAFALHDWGARRKGRAPFSVRIRRPAAARLNVV